MNSAKELLYSVIASLSDEEAHQLLEFVQCLRMRNGNSSTLGCLASDPTFQVPTGVNFRAVKPAQGRGVDASRLLVEDRR